MELTYKFSDLDNSKVKEAGGKNASLGEMFQKLSSKGINVPDGFATTSEAYWRFIEDNELKKFLRKQLDELDKKNFKNLSQVGERIRKKILKGNIPEDIENAIRDGFKALKKREKKVTSVAARSSATAEDLPEASFAGQHESYMNIESEDELLEAWKKCVSSLFTDRAIKYREENEFDHMKVALSVGIQKMVRSDKASAGVCFTLDPETGFDQVILINGAWGLGENVVKGAVRNDEYYVFKHALKKGNKAILSKKLGSKEKMMVYAEKKKGDNTIENKDTPEKLQKTYVLTDKEIMQLGKWCLSIEEHYQEPMDIEWAKDGETEEIYIVQARPETVHSSKKEKTKLKKYEIHTNGTQPLIKGVGIGNKIAKGTARILESPDEAEKIKEGDVLVTEITNPDWDTIIKKVSAIVTNSGGRTSHAAIVAREMGAVAVVGTGNATEKIEDGKEVTVSSAQGKEGKITVLAQSREAAKF